MRRAAIPVLRICLISRPRQQLSRCTRPGVRYNVVKSSFRPQTCVWVVGFLDVLFQGPIAPDTTTHKPCRRSVSSVAWNDFGKDVQRKCCQCWRYTRLTQGSRSEAFKYLAGSMCFGSAAHNCVYSGPNDRIGCIASRASGSVAIARPGG